MCGAPDPGLQAVRSIPLNELILFGTKRYMKRIPEAMGSSYSSDMIRASGSELKKPRLTQ